MGDWIQGVTLKFPFAQCHTSLGAASHQQKGTAHSCPGHSAVPTPCSCQWHSGHSVGHSEPTRRPSSGVPLTPGNSSIGVSFTILHIPQAAGAGGCRWAPSCGHSGSYPADLPERSLPRSPAGRLPRPELLEPAPRLSPGCPGSRETPKL